MIPVPIGGPAPAPAAETLQRLVLLRYFTAGGIAAALAAENRLFQMDWDPQAMSAGLAALVLANLATHWRARRGWPVTNLEFFGHLLFDVTVLTLLLRWSGGSENPLVSLYLIPLVIAAAVLPA